MRKDCKIVLEVKKVQRSIENSISTLTFMEASICALKLPCDYYHLPNKFALKEKIVKSFRLFFTCIAFILFKRQIFFFYGALKKKQYSFYFTLVLQQFM